MALLDAIDIHPTPSARRHWRALVPVVVDCDRGDDDESASVCGDHVISSVSDDCDGRVISNANASGDYDGGAMTAIGHESVGSRGHGLPTDRTRVWCPASPSRIVRHVSALRPHASDADARRNPGEEESESENGCVNEDESDYGKDERKRRRMARVDLLCAPLQTPEEWMWKWSM